VTYLANSGSDVPHGVGLHIQLLERLLHVIDPEGVEVKRFAEEVFVDYRIDGERGEDSEGVKSDRFDPAAGRLGNCIRA